MKIELNCGIWVNIEKEVFDDMQIVDLLAELEDGNGLVISKLSKLIFKPEDKKAIYNALKDEHGRIPVNKFAETFTEIFNKLGENGKNS